MKDNELEIGKFMKNLDLTREEALALIEADNSKEITPEMKVIEQKAKVVKKGMAKSVDAYGKTREREKKINPDKVFLIDRLSNAMKYDDLKIVNDEREFTFLYKNVEYKVVMSQPRPKKAK